MPDEMQGEVNFENLDQATLVDDLLWPFRKYDTVNDFIARDGFASTLIGFSGLVLSSIGLAPGVAAAVGVLGFATSITRLILMIVLNSRTPLQDIGLRGAGVSTVVYMSAAFALYIVIGPGDIVNIAGSIFQFALGIIVTYLAGFTYMRLYKYLSYTSTRIRYLIPSIGSLMVVLLFVLGLPEFFRLLSFEEAAELIRVENGTEV